MTSRALVFLCVATLAGCTCGPGLINTGPLELTVAPERVEFPPTFVGQTRTTALELTQRRGPKTAFSPTLDAPFSVGPAAFSLVAGQSQTLEVQFSPTSPGVFSARLKLEAREVEVHGEALVRLRASRRERACPRRSTSTRRSAARRRRPTAPPARRAA